MSKLVTHQPRLSDDPDLGKDNPAGNKKKYYMNDDGVLQRTADFLAYPETRVEAATGKVRPVCADEFVGTGPGAGGKPIPNDAMPDTDKPESILGGPFKNTGGNFNNFLEGLRQLCRNYNFCLFHLRQDLFKKKFGSGPHDLPPKITAFEAASDQLSEFLRTHDPRLPGNNGKFKDLAVEFVKVNEYIASIRAGCTELQQPGGGGLETDYSSSSFNSISSMFSSSSFSSSSSP